MLASGNLLYGTALYGGYMDCGVIYTINTSGSGYTPIHVFQGGSTDGINPHSGVIIVGSYLYGLTALGGTNNNGVLYRSDLSGGNLMVLHSFHNSSGDQSHGRLTLSSDGNLLFGITRKGGGSDSGVVFSYNITTMSYDTLHNFMGAPNDAAYSDHGFLTRSGDTLFGMTQSGGAMGEGAVFAINEDGSNFRLLHSFGTANNDGNNPYGSLALSYGYLYGMTREGGVNNYGTVFRIKTDGNKYETLYSFDVATSGGYPIDNVVLNSDGNRLYGLTQVGGANDPIGSNQYGTIFSLYTLNSISIQTISSEIPGDIKLYQNEPNPFNPSTRIRFDLSKAANVKLSVYDVTGREIFTLVNEHIKAGKYEISFDIANLNIASGIYFYVLKSDEYLEAKRMALLK